jgi:ABC-type hemin transport system ATPase subunit
MIWWPVYIDTSLKLEHNLLKYHQFNHIIEERVSNLEKTSTTLGMNKMFSILCVIFVSSTLNIDYATCDVVRFGRCPHVEVQRDFDIDKVTYLLIHELSLKFVKLFW